MTHCERLKQCLIDNCLDGLRADQELSAHVELCVQCRALTQAYAAVPGLLEKLPAHPPGDALVEQTLAAVNAARPGTSVQFGRRQRFASVLGGAMVVLSVMALFPLVIQEAAMMPRDAQYPTSTLQQPASSSRSGTEGGSFEKESDRRIEGGVVDLPAEPEPVATPDPAAEGDYERDSSDTDGAELDRIEVTGSRITRPDLESASAAVVIPIEHSILGGENSNQDVELSGRLSPARDQDEAVASREYARPATPEPVYPGEANGPALKSQQERGDDDGKARELLAVGKQNKPKLGTGGDDNFGFSDQRKKDQVTGIDDRQADSESEAPGIASGSGRASQAGSSGHKRAANKGLMSALEESKESPPEHRELESLQRNAIREKNAAVEDRIGEARQRLSDMNENENVGDRLGADIGGLTNRDNGGSPETPGSVGQSKEPLKSPSYRSAGDKPGADGQARKASKTNADAYFEHYSQSESLTFQDATGYWANTYVPGDPEIRLLNARVRDWQDSTEGLGEELDQAVVPNRQPFDSPADNALALSLMSDLSAVEGTSRMRLQVGLQAIDHRRGQRPTLNMSVVLDLPADAADVDRIKARALLDALLDSRQSGDRFSLVMTGASGGLAIAADEFRHGTVQLVKNQIVEQQGNDRAHTSLIGALEIARDVVRASDDPSRPLGSSSILLISAGELTPIDELSAFAHSQATDGISLSVIPLGARATTEHVDRLVLSGLGNRRVLPAADEARAVIEEELHASSRAVARSARLAIRLAPGVKLIDVIGSHRLDDDRAQQVRDIEQSMDHRLSTHLGIEADRGEDEDGIQIVIPSIYGGDSLFILLDVLVETPGTVAEVTLRYKDLVYLRNGALRGQLTLPKGESSNGPAQRLVSKNLMAHQMVKAIRQAAEALSHRQPKVSSSVLENMLEIIRQARQRIPEWENDTDLLNDHRVLEGYLRTLASPEAAQWRPRIADSLRLAAWRKSHRPPEEWQ